MRRQIIVSLLCIIALLALGLGTTAILIRTRPTPPRIDVAHPALLVQTITLEPQTVVEPIVGYGTARADQYAWISAQVAGEIIERPETSKAGAAIKRGDVLLRIDDQEYARRLTQVSGLLAADRSERTKLDVEQDNLAKLVEITRREFESTQYEYETVTELRQNNAASQREFETARRVFERIRAALQQLENEQALMPQRRARLDASIQAREAELELARLNVDRCTIRAPFDGRIDQVLVDAGNRVRIGDPVCTLLDPEQIDVPIELPVSVRPRIRLGAPCTLYVDSMKDICWGGRVERIAPSANEATRTFTLYAEVDNRQQAHELVPGFFVRAVIDGPTFEQAMVIPRGAIQKGQVFLCQNGHAVPRAVQVERHLIDRTIVTGVEPGDVVITSNFDALFEGAPVRIEAAPDAVPLGRTAAARPDGLPLTKEQ
ncbi:MAG: efflux RND transporter periplasmic adaptor subunit [Phycisphaerae bacterium]|nr:efflux RND transporter periplasmic adaptor subunit [Phycisphaerae bacterium]